MSAAPALPTRDADSTFGPNHVAELSKVVLVPDGMSRWPEPRGPALHGPIRSACNLTKEHRGGIRHTAALATDSTLAWRIEATPFQVVFVACMWCARPYAHSA